jgi:cytochrome b6-f complex iron-sulfur subunit
LLVAVIIVIGVLLLAALVLAMARRQDTQRAVGVLSRETRKRDRSEAAIKPIAEETPVLTGRQVERAAAAGRRTGTAVMEAPAVSTVPYTPPAPVDMEALGVTRRQFLNRAVLGVFGLSLASFGATMLAFLWPPPNNGGFGSKVPAGKLDDILATIDANKGPAYVPNARAYVNRYPIEDVDKAKKAGYSDAIVAGYSQGLVALYQKCVHLGCRVPWCTTSQWFECPCHGSQYNRVGEKKGGPAPRGLDRFAVSADGGVVTIDTKQVIVGPPIGTNTTGQEAEGPHCH